MCLFHLMKIINIVKTTFFLDVLVIFALWKDQFNFMSKSYLKRNTLTMTSNTCLEILKIQCLNSKHNSLDPLKT